MLPNDFFTLSTKMWSSGGIGIDGFGASFGLRENKPTPSRYHALDTPCGPENTSDVTHDMLKDVLSAASSREEDGWWLFPNGRLLSLYAAHEGVSLTVQKIEAIHVAHGLIHARTNKGDTYLVALEDVFAAAFDAAAESKTARKAGFLG